MTSRRKEGTPASQAATELPTPREEQVRQEIEHARQQLGETLEALAAKADLKARAQEAAPRFMQQAVARGVSIARQRPVPLAAAAVALILGYLATRRWRA